MVPILNHSLLIKINNNIIKLTMEIVISIGVDITILELNQIDSIEVFSSASGSG